MLSSLGANVEAKDAMSFTPLHRAAVTGNYECTRALLECKANPDSGSEHMLLLTCLGCGADPYAVLDASPS